MMDLEHVEQLIAEFQRLGIKPDGRGIYSFDSPTLSPEQLLTRLRALPDGAGSAAAFAALAAESASGSGGNERAP